MSGKFSMDDYVDVAERIAQFYERYPNGRLVRDGDPEILNVGDRIFIMYTALAMRDPEDRVPAVGTAWEPFPGPTQYTRDSELMNAETAAWGRAIVAAGFPSKKIASRQEVQARTAEPIKPEPTITVEAALNLAELAEGIEPDRLQLAVSHVTRTDVGSCDGLDNLVAALGKLTTSQATRVEAWIAKTTEKVEATADA